MYANAGLEFSLPCLALGAPKNLPIGIMVCWWKCPLHRISVLALTIINFRPAIGMYKGWRRPGIYPIQQLSLATISDALKCGWYHFIKNHFLKWNLPDSPSVIPDSPFSGCKCSAQDVYPDTSDTRETTVASWYSDLASSSDDDDGAIEDEQVKHEEVNCRSFGPENYGNDK